MRQTSLRLVVGLVVLGVAIGWALLGLLRGVMTAVPALSWSVAGGLAVLAIALFGGGWYVYDRVHRKGFGVNALLAFRLLLFAKASLLVGSIVCGGYAGLGLRRMSLLGDAISSEQVIIAFVSAGAAGLVMVGAVLLERACKVPEDDDQSGSVNGMAPSS